MGQRMAAAIIGVLAVIASAASAEVLTDSRGLKANSPMAKYLFSQAFFKSMAEAAGALDRDLGIACAEDYSITPVNFIVLRPIDLPDGAKEAASGAWIYRYDVQRCGKTKRNNLLVEVQKDGPRADILLPGETFATPRQMTEAIPMVGAYAAPSLEKVCKEIRVADTRIVKPPVVAKGAKGPTAPWKENWVVQGCGKQVDVPVTFTPNPKGGSSMSVGK
jgi:hypothetical protein